MDSTQKLWNKDYTLIVLANVFASVGFYFVQPTLPRYVTSLGLSLTIAGVITGLFSITALFCRPFTGVVADRVSPKKILLIALPVEAVAGALYGLFPNPAWLIGCRIIHAICFAFVGTVLIVYGSSFVPKERMGEGIGYLGMGNVVGTAIGPSLGLSLCNSLGYKAAFVVGGLVIGLGAIAVALTKGTTSEEKKEKRSVNLKNMISTKLIPLSFMNGLFSFSNGLISSYLSMLADVRGVAGIGTYFTVLAVCLFVIRPTAGKLNDKKGLAAVAIPGFCCTIVGLILISRAASLVMYLAAAVFMAFGQGAAQPAFQTACVKMLPAEERGIATSTYYVFADVFQGLGPMIGGSLATAMTVDGTPGYSSMYLVCAAVLACGLLLFIFYYRKKKAEGINL